MNTYEFPFVTCGKPQDVINDKQRNMNNYVIYMLDRTAQMFKVKNLPETIPEKWLKLYLMTGGFAIISNEYNGDLFAYQGGLGGVPDTYYFPTIATVANPYQNFSRNLKIGEECVVVPNDTAMRGIIPICEKYASLLVEADISLRMASINARAVNVFRCGDDNAAKRAQKFLDDLEAGKLGVAVGGSGQDWKAQTDTLPLSSNSSAGYITQLLELRQYFWGMLWQELGVNTAHNMKREAINGTEAGLNDKALLPLIDDMLENWKTGFDMVNKKYGTSITVEKESAWKVTEDEIEESLEEENNEEVSQERNDEDGENMENVE